MAIIIQTNNPRDFEGHPGIMGRFGLTYWLSAISIGHVGAVHEDNTMYIVPPECKRYTIYGGTPIYDASDDTPQEFLAKHPLPEAPAKKVYDYSDLLSVSTLIYTAQISAGEAFKDTANAVAMAKNLIDKVKESI